MLVLALLALLASCQAELTWDDMGTVITVSYSDFDELILRTPLPSVLAISGLPRPSVLSDD